MKKDELLVKDVEIPAMEEIKKFVSFQNIAKRAGEAMMKHLPDEESDEYKEAWRTFTNIIDLQYKAVQKNPSLPVYADALTNSKYNLN